MDSDVDVNDVGMGLVLIAFVVVMPSSTIVVVTPAVSVVVGVSKLMCVRGGRLPRAATTIVHKGYGGPGFSLPDLLVLEYCTYY